MSVSLTEVVRQPSPEPRSNNASKQAPSASVESIGRQVREMELRFTEENRGALFLFNRLPNHDKQQIARAFCEALQVPTGVSVDQNIAKCQGRVNEGVYAVMRANFTTLQDWDEKTLFGREKVTSDQKRSFVGEISSAMGQRAERLDVAVDGKTYTAPTRLVSAFNQIRSSETSVTCSVTEKETGKPLARLTSGYGDGATNRIDLIDISALKRNIG